MGPKLWLRLTSQYREFYAHMGGKSKHRGFCAHTRERVSTENPYPEQLLLLRPTELALGRAQLHNINHYTISNGQEMAASRLHALQIDSHRW